MIPCRGRARQCRPRLSNLVRIFLVSKTDLFLKVEVQHDSDEKPERIGEELCRQIKKNYGVIGAELSHFTVIEE